MKIFVTLLLGLLSFNIFCSESELKFLTYNTELDPGFVPFIKERRPFIIDKLLEEDPDVICLQEVWREKDLNLMIQDLGETYPHFYYPPIRQKYESLIPTCGFEELYGKGKILSCLWNKCRSERNRKFNQCLMGNCLEEYESLLKKNRKCSNALIVQFQEKSFWGLFSLLNPFKGSGVFLNGGSTGLVLFSKKKLTNKTFFNFSEISTWKKRGALSSDVTFGKKEYKIICTQLTRNLDYETTYTGIYNSWEEENDQQMAKLLSRIVGLKKAIFLMGDFNCSYSVPEKNIAKENIKSCERPLKHGFSNFLYQKKPHCTYCEGNDLLYENRHDGLMIDHIFVKNKQISDSNILFDEMFEFNSVKEKTVKTHLSGHYGVQITHLVE